MIGVPSNDIWHILKELGFEGNLFIGFNPDEEGVVTSIIDTGGINANPKWLRDDLTVQFYTRSRPHQYQQAYKELYNIRNYLLGVNTKTVSSVETTDGFGIDVDGTVYVNYLENTSQIINVGDTIDYIRFILLSDITFIGQDQNNRPELTMNMVVTREERQAVGNREPLS